MYGKKILLAFAVILACFASLATTTNSDPKKEKFLVMAYYAGDETAIDNYDLNGLTHIIYSFCFLDGNRMIIPENRISVVKKLVSLKNEHSGLKIILALGGWGGCETCSDVFSVVSGRNEFAASVKELMEIYNVDGIDLDWEYPAIPGYPGHPYKPEDKRNFTLLIKELRNILGKDYEIGFAAGGFTRFFNESVEWDQVMPLVDYVNIMTYDLVSAGPTTGHHTPLFSLPEQTLSVDYAVNYLDSLGVDCSKLIIGAAFYGRVWENVPDIQNGLFQPGNFNKAISYNDLQGWISENGLTEMWDKKASAPFAWSAEKGLFVTFDNPRSVSLKTKYAKKNRLGGIMFWQLGGDSPVNGLLESIYRELK